MTREVKMIKHKQIIENSNKRYDERSEQFPLTSSAVFWDDAQTQYLRFHEIVKHLSMESDSTVLDIGCGHAELYKYLNFNGFRGQYKGIDINENLLVQAQTLYPKIEVEKLDILEQEISEKFDYIVLSGLFNLNYGQDIQWVEKMLSAMYGLANKKVVFNAISTYVNFKQEEMFYIDPLEILDFALKNLSSRISLEHGVLPYNYLVVIEKDNNWKSINSL